MRKDQRRDVKVRHPLRVYVRHLMSLVWGLVPPRRPLARNLDRVRHHRARRRSCEWLFGGSSRLE